VQAVNDMLMSSYSRCIRLFDAWPTGQDASFTTLRAKGAFLVSASLTGGVVGSVRIEVRGYS
jgi:alpha-L-fucosidase 2